MRTTFKNKSHQDRYDKIVKDRANSLETRRVAHSGKEISFLRISIQPNKKSERSYNISIQHTGKTMLENIRIRYEPILLWAEHFGIDTTHMPQHYQFAKDDPIAIDLLPPNSCIEFTRNGYAEHQAYDGPRETQVYITDPTDEAAGVPINTLNWCKAIIDLPNAKGKRII